MADEIRPTDFYAEALSEAERLRLPKAEGMAGLEGEIALLRIRLFTAAQEHPEDLAVLLKGFNALVRLVALRYRLSDKPANELSKSIEGVLQGIGGALYPERFSDV